MWIKANVFANWDEGAFYWNLKAANGEIVACSPHGFADRMEAEKELLYFGVGRKESAVNKKKAAGDFSGPGYHIFEGEDDQWYWNYTKVKGVIVAKGGEGYATRSSCEAAVMRMKEAVFAEPGF